MPDAAQTLEPRAGDAELVLNTLPEPVLVIGREGRITFVNLAAENFFRAGANSLTQRRINDLVAYDSRLLALIEQVKSRGHSISEYGVDIDSPGLGPHRVDIHVALMDDSGDKIAVSLRERGIAEKMDHQLVSRGAARSVSAMAAVLAHEIKNPLSGIRGAAQLLSRDSSEEERGLTQLICDETDRICSLVDQIESFGFPAAQEKKSVNIHQVLDHVLKIARAGFAKNLSIAEIYDPSIPAVAGDRDQLIQVFLNLLKNAAEAVDDVRGEIRLTTAYRHGVRIGVPGSSERLELPIEVCVIDNGPGISGDIADQLFEPFVTTKPDGTGLGLSLVAKIINDHGGVVEHFDSSGGTTFRVLLPAHKPRTESEA